MGAILPDPADQRLRTKGDGEQALDLGLVDLVSEGDLQEGADSFFERRSPTCPDPEGPPAIARRR